MDFRQQVERERKRRSFGLGTAPFSCRGGLTSQRKLGCKFLLVLRSQFGLATLVVIFTDCGQVDKMWASLGG